MMLRRRVSSPVSRSDRLPDALPGSPGAPPESELDARLSWHRDGNAPWWAFLVSYSNFRLTLPTLLAWSAAMCFHQACQIHIINFAESFPDDVTRSPPLRDVLHESLPNLAHARAAAEALHVTPVLLAGGCMLRAFDQRSLDALRTFLWVHGSLMALRGLCFAVTLLPDASRSCRESPFMGSCHDLVFSGHVLIMTLGSLTARLFFVLPAGFTPILVLSTLGTAAFIAAARNHYTLDVLLSLILTPLVWYVWTTHETCVALAMLDPEKSMVGAGRAFRSRRAGGRPSDDDSSVTSSGNQSTPTFSPSARLA